MHLAIGHYGVPKDVSGVTTWLSGLVSEAHDKGHTLDLLIHDLGADPYHGSFILQNGACAKVATAVSKPRWTEDAVHQILDFLNTARPQVFLPQCLAGMYFAARYAEQHGLPWIFTVHSDDPFYWGLLEECAPTSPLGKVVVVSDYLNSEVRRRGLAENPITIPCGVVTPSIQARFRRKPFRVVFSGRVVEEQKRISLVLEAMGMACKADPGIQCLILGDGTSRAASQQWVQDHGLSDRIQFVGPLKPSETIDRLADCQAFLLMSDYEGLPVSLLEAMASGVVPIVRLISSGISQVVKPDDTGLLTTEDPADAAAAILRLAKNEDLWTKLSTNARALVSRDYNAEDGYRKWLDLLDELAAKSAPQFPLPNPRKLPLRAVNLRLVTVDQRRPIHLGWLRFYFCGFVRKVQKLLAK